MGRWLFPVSSVLGLHNPPFCKGLHFLFDFAWKSRYRLPMLILVGFMVFDVRMQLEINVDVEVRQLYHHHHDEDSDEEDEDVESGSERSDGGETDDETDADDEFDEYTPTGSLEDVRTTSDAA